MKIVIKNTQTTQTPKTAYIIRDDKLVAVIRTTLKAGAQVRFAFHSCEEAIDASRSQNLVNARWGKISYAKKWEKVALKNGYNYVGEEINDNEFLLS